MSHTVESGLFSLLPDKRPPWREFLFSMTTEGLALVLLAWVGVVHPEVLIPPTHDYHFVSLVNTPPPVNHQPAPVRVLKPIDPPPAVIVENNALRLPPEVRKPVQHEETPVAPKINLAAEKIPAVQAPAPRIPRDLVKTNVFSTGSSATPTIAAAPAKVQTGGFGDPNGVPARDPHGKAVNIAALGSYDLPAGPGYGNGTGGAKGVRGVVASAGFGNGVAIGDGSGTTNTTRGTGTVRQSGFGDAEPAQTASLTPKTVPLAPKIVPAEILSKPVPTYTEEARKLRIEGEVLLEVTFEASGRLHVVRVVRGLGHGLDEAAIQAAEQIHFRPALRDGQPADSNAVLHIIFQLA